MSDGPIVVWGEVLWDRFVTGEQLGGAPANVAWHLGMAGQWSVLATRVGADDWGDKAVEVLSQFVDTAIVQRDAIHATGEVHVQIFNGEPRYQLIADRAWEHIACDTEVVAAITEASAFVYGTLSQRTISGFQQWQRAVHKVQPGCIKVCDPNLRGNMVAMSEHEKNVLYASLMAADVIKINQREHDAIATIFGWSDPVATLQQQPRTIAVTHGELGSTLYSPGAAPLQIPAHSNDREAGDNVGCGDAYLALLLHGLLSGWELHASATVASQWAGQVARCIGATPTFDDDLIASMLGDVGMTA
jgi:fructokinase